MANEELIQQIINGDLQTLWNILSVYKDEDEHLSNTYTNVKEGYQLKFHINYILTNRYNERQRAQEIELNGDIYNDTEWWDEEEQRKTHARKALLEYFMLDNKPYEGR